MAIQPIIDPMQQHTVSSITGTAVIVSSGSKQQQPPPVVARVFLSE
jgi:hypothetical protein